MPKVTLQIHTQPPMERMLQIHERLQQSKFPNCNRMAREFEVSSRTIKRDIDFMKCRLNLPIEYDSRRYGFYYAAEVDQFPSRTHTGTPWPVWIGVSVMALSWFCPTPHGSVLDHGLRPLTAIPVVLPPGKL